MSVQKKIILYVYGTVLLMFAVLSVFLFSFAEKSTRNSMLNSALDTVTYTCLLIEREQKYLYGVADQYALSPEVHNMTTLSNMGIKNIKMSSYTNSSIKSQMYVVGLALYNRYGENIDYISNDASHGPVKQDPKDPLRPFNMVISGEQKYIWEYIPQGSVAYLERDNSPKLSLWYVVRNNVTLRPIGAVAVSVDTRKLLSGRRASDSLYDDLLVVDNSSTLIIGNGKSYQKLTAEDIKSLMKQVNPFQNTGHYLTTINGIEQNVVYAKTSGKDFTVLALIPNRAFFWNIQAYSVYSLGGIVLCTILLLPLLVMISSTITHPLNILMHSMQHFRDGDKNARIDFKHNDEIGKIGKIFNEMVAENNRLIKGTYLLTIERQAAELSIMQAQINPHFIYNMINSIQWTAIDKGDDEIAQIAYSIGQVFRITLNRGKSHITILKERELLEYYLTLQKKRFGDRLTYQLDFDESILDVKIPKLIIQPLVENSIIHGVKSSSSSVHVQVKVWPTENGKRICIKVDDNGCGIPPDVLCLLPDKLPATMDKESSKFAMKNIADRLKLYYYEQGYRFDIQSEEHCGVHILIDIPTVGFCDKDQ